MPTTTPSHHGRAARTLLVVNAGLAVVALIPCLGWMNWMVIPLCLGTMTLGVVGWLTLSEPQQESTAKGPYIAAILGGMLLFGTSTFRLLLGGGVL